jgi:hypothetical protein
MVTHTPNRPHNNDSASRISDAEVDVPLANFYEKALFVKPTWRLLLEAECNGFDCPSRYASIRTLGELSLW